MGLLRSRFVCRCGCFSKKFPIHHCWPNQIFCWCIFRCVPSMHIIIIIIIISGLSILGPLKIYFRCLHPLLFGGSVCGVRYGVVCAQCFPDGCCSAVAKLVPKTLNGIWIWNFFPIFMEYNFPMKRMDVGVRLWVGGWVWAVEIEKSNGWRIGMEE